ncbi:threonine dehydratase [Parasphingopyxis marina]|uniref:Threonine dehydratase n=1 Tax=Parasphingopyxis marina TaxID=2761622 RepID=A0A842HWZ5_9SPHN|nr:threonine dehydratase [Parasphingopyxis marina]MBC2777415.1 threonine dehydratase [Parasphingopyxis marina]
MQFTLDELRTAAERVHREMAPTPQYPWPLLGERLGCEVWVKHENHTPTGAFKARGAITYIDWLKREHPEVPGIITATRGNHGQAQTRAAIVAGLEAVIYVPHGNSQEKNRAMRGFGAELIEHGSDFDEARVEAGRVAKERGLWPVPAFHKELARGVATYGLELFDAAGELDAVYVPIGCGSGICGTIAARDALGMKTEIIGVVASGAPGAKLSFEAGKVVETNEARTFADGAAVRVPVAEALAIYGEGASRIVAVDDADTAEAMRILWQDTHNLVEGAGALSLAGLIAERDAMAGKRVGVIVSGGNIDQSMAAEVLAGGTPQA